MSQEGQGKKSKGNILCIPYANTLNRVATVREKYLENEIFF